MIAHAEQPARRVLLVVDACSEPRPLVDLAVDLAREMMVQGETHLYGLFIEDEDLLSIAELPCSREISRHTASQHSTSRARMQDLYRRQSERFHRYLEQQAVAARLSWSSANRVGRGSDQLQVVDDIAACRIVAMPTSRYLHQSSNRVRRVILLQSHSNLLLLALRMLIHRLRDQRLQVLLIEPAVTENASSAWQPALQRWQQQYPLLDIRQYPHEYLSDLLAHAPACDYVILSKDEPAEILHGVFHGLRCPVLLVD